MCEAILEIAYGFVEFLFTWDLARQVKLATDFISGFKQGHLVPPLSGVDGKCHPSRARAHHSQAFG